MRTPRQSLLTLLAVVVAACSGKDATKVVTPASITAGATSSGLTATVGTALATAPTFVVKDAAGNVLTGVPHWPRGANSHWGRLRKIRS